MSINTEKKQDENSADEIACRKADLRKQMKKILSDIHTGGLHEEKSRAAADRFFSSNLYKDCDSVFAFVSGCRTQPEKIYVKHADYTFMSSDLK